MQPRTADNPHHSPPFLHDITPLKIRLFGIAIATFLIAALVFFATDQVALMLHRRHQQPDTENLARELNTFIVQNYSEAVRNLAARVEVVNVSSGKTANDNPALLRVLNTAKGVLNVSLVYVMNREGTVVGCSNDPDVISLTGNNYRFRPYFFRALAGMPFIFPAVGVTTKVKGVYFSTPVHEANGGKPIGVLVLKTRSNVFDAIYTSVRSGLEVLLLSPDGVVFSSTQNQWDFRTAWPIEPVRLQELKATRQFSDQELASLPFSLAHSVVHYDDLRATVAIHPLQIEGWNVATVAPLAFPWLAVLVLVSTVLALGTLTAIIVHNAHKERQLASQVLAGQEASSRANAAHRASVMELETIFSTSLVGIVLVRGGRIANANKRMAEMFGFELNELIDGDVRQLFSGRRAFRRFVRRHLHLLMDSNIEQMEYNLRKKDGTLIPCTLSGKAIDRSNLALGTVWVIEDVSRRKVAEQELEQARAAAEAASVAKGQFLANMSHEIRTPMNGIIGLTNILLQQGMPVTQRGHLKLIQRSAIRLMTIINDILDFSKLGAGRFELEQRPFSVRSLLREVIQPMELRVRRKNLQLKLTVDAGVPHTILGDQIKIMQVLTNLIDNSLKFTRKGQVHLEVRLEQPNPEVPATILFTVTDTGIGIGSAYRDKVFESFSQADSSHSRKFGGSGLGLSISKGLVELMGGRIWFESVPGRGTSFYFTLPLVAPVTTSPIPPDDPPTPCQPDHSLSQGHGSRILVAEDEYINTILISTLLKQAGYHVTTVRCGREAVDAWRGGVFDCILMDIQMPEMDGYEAVARIREVEADGAHIPIIAMTAHAMRGDRQKCLDAGMDDYVAKPIDGTMVLRLLRQYLPAPEAQDPVRDEAERL